MEETTTTKRRRRRRNVDAETSVDTVNTQSSETTDEDVYALFGLKREPETEKAENAEKAEKNESGAAEIKKVVKSEAKKAKKIEVGATYELPFTRLYQSSVAKLPICVCSGAVEIISDEIHDGRINVLNHGTKLKGWIDITEI